MWYIEPLRDVHGEPLSTFNKLLEEEEKYRLLRLEQLMREKESDSTTEGATQTDLEGEQF